MAAIVKKRCFSSHKAIWGSSGNVIQFTATCAAHARAAERPRRTVSGIIVKYQALKSSGLSSPVTCFRAHKSSEIFDIISAIVFQRRTHTVFVIRLSWEQTFARCESHRCRIPLFAAHDTLPLPLCGNMAIFSVNLPLSASKHMQIWKMIPIGEQCSAVKCVPTV